MSTAALAAGRCIVTGREARARLVLALLAVLLSVALFASVGLGAVDIAPGQVLAMLARPIGLDLPWTYDAGQEAVLFAIRLPRTLLGLLVGAALAVSGAALQGLFRNPLADPGLIGVSSGAALAAVTTIVLGAPVAAAIGLPQTIALPVTAFAGGLVATLLVYRFASVGGRTVVATMLLAGIAVQAVAAAGIGLMIFLSNDDQLRTLNFWLLGSLASTTWAALLPTVPFLLAAIVALPLLARPLNSFLLGEREAGHLGIEVEAFKRRIVVLVALSVGAAVATSGVIAFVGLVVPHLLRLVVGPDHRVVLPGSALLGASLLIGADIVARLLVVPAELPIGIVTSLIGGPFFLWLLARGQRRRSLG
jgi:iron complex transport system permease protein